jgi:dihydroxyacetone kinase-like predicted kinase
MREALDAVSTGEVTVASRDAHVDGLVVRKGQYLGLADGRPVASGESFDEVAEAVVAHLLSEPREVLTLLTGADEPALERLLASVVKAHPDLELDVQTGGQPHYPLLLAAE